MAKALGIDIGGTGIKGAIVDTDTGELISERLKLPTPEGGSPDDIVKTVMQLIENLGGLEDGVPVGVCFPAIVRNGRTMSAANVSSIPASERSSPAMAAGCSFSRSSTTDASPTHSGLVVTSTVLLATEVYSSDVIHDQK